MYFEVNVGEGEACLHIVLASRILFGITTCLDFFKQSNIRLFLKFLALKEDAGNKSFETAIIIYQSTRHNAHEFSEFWSRNSLMN